ncbi:acyltransferase family protein [Microbacterium sp. NPDC096154]|uniref:acyltransferase family protein n=1 Tax=Microbacterium sp. NPDC096154 TaxID=3155549 RepID=UPI00331A9E82
MRLDIQGLRALAVALVVVFHLAPAALPGGYIGVDVFFVISGFLITAHLLREVERTGTVRVTEFWARRVRRLLPAAFLVLIVSALAALFLLPRTVLLQNLSEIALAAVYVLNWGLAANSVDYLAESNDPSLVQHYWSLSVEEQFYLVWPLLVIAALWAATKAGRGRDRRAITVMLLVVLAASFTFSVYATGVAQPSAYFVTPTRAWEFAAGGLVALLPSGVLRAGRSHALLSWAAAGAIVGSAVLFDENTAFPGWIALVPVLATATLLWAGDSDSTWAPQYLAKAAPVQLIGDTSYAIYLWHWPLIVGFTALAGRAPGWKWALVIGAASVALAIATKQLVEDPVRSTPRRWMSRRLPTFAFMAAGIAVVSAVTVLPAEAARAQNADVIAEAQTLIDDEDGCFGAYAVLNDCDDPYARTGTVNATVAQEDRFRETGVLADSARCDERRVATQLETTCALGDSDSSARAVLLGDSHAEHLATALDAVASDRGWSLEMRTRSGCSGFMSPEAGRDPARQGCVPWGDEVYEAVLAAEDIDVVIVAARTFLYPAIHHRALAEERLSALIDAGKRVVVIRDVPGALNEWPLSHSAESVPQCVARTGGDDACAWDPPAIEDWLLEAARSVDADVVDPWEVLCDDAGCHSIIGGTIVYFDDNHLTTTFARTLAPWLQRELESAFAAAR